LRCFSSFIPTHKDTDNILVYLQQCVENINLSEFSKINNSQSMPSVEVFNPFKNNVLSQNISRNFDYNCELILKEIRFNDPAITGIRNMYLSGGIDFSVLKWDFYNKTVFNVKPPGEIDFTIHNSELKNIFFFFLNKSYLFSPVYRLTNRYSRNVKMFGAEINKIRYPQNLILKNIGNSLDNVDYLKNLNESIDIVGSAMNNYNMALDNNTTLFISKRIYGEDSELIKQDKDVNFKSKILCDYNNEIIGKSLFNFSIDSIHENLGYDTIKSFGNIMNFKVFFNSDVTEEPYDLFSTFEMITLINFNYFLKINKGGET